MNEYCECGAMLRVTRDPQDITLHHGILRQDIRIEKFTLEMLAPFLLDCHSGWAANFSPPLPAPSFTEVR